ncbi:transcription factor HES-4-like [Strongylocentrotus purpuratus]|uniref:BHLH domain-containing protein n=1 Tax=Strongylocentrotus purpuratus TaxID=7668 RepID=A0A7M7NXV6_STRPU|nr:transcription factor HES-4-like [Strongylocentrotus purpuratus]
MSEFGVWKKVLILRETYLRRAMPTDDQHPPSRSLKPQMEKRRRARINDSLLQLKSLVLDALNKNNPRHSKWRRLIYLEMTVRYLRSIHRQQLSEISVYYKFLFIFNFAGIGSHNEQANIAQYQTGYAECMREVSRYLKRNQQHQQCS